MATSVFRSSSSGNNGSAGSFGFPRIIKIKKAVFDRFHHPKWCLDDVLIVKLAKGNMYLDPVTGEEVIDVYPHSREFWAVSPIIVNYVEEEVLVNEDGFVLDSDGRVTNDQVELYP